MWLETSNQIAANNSYAVQLFIRDIDYSLQMIWVGQEVHVNGSKEVRVRGQPGFETQRMGNLWIHTNGDIYLTEDALAHLNNRRCQLWSSLVEIDQLK